MNENVSVRMQMHMDGAVVDESEINQNKPELRCE